MFLPSAEVAENLGNTLTKWAGLIIIPTASIMALPALIRRDIQHAIVTLVIVMVVGAFAFDGSGVQNFVTTAAKTVFK